MSDPLKTAIHDAVDEAFRRFHHDLPTRWVLISEVLGANGKRAVWTLPGPDMCPWDLLGLIEYVRLLEYVEHDE